MEKKEYDDILNKACCGNKWALQQLRDLPIEEFNKHANIKTEYNRMSIKFEACNNILECIRKSFWQYLLFRFKI